MEKIVFHKAAQFEKKKQQIDKTHYEKKIIHHILY